jgi:hypothetical protein
MFRWFCFWRRKQLRKAYPPERQAEPSSENQPEAISMKEELRDDPKPQVKDARRLVVVRPNTVPAVETESAEDEADAKPLVVPTLGPHVVSQPANTPGTKAEALERSFVSQVDVFDLSRDERAIYFTHGCYALASLGPPRLTAPGLLPDTRRQPRPRTVPGQDSSAEATSVNPQGRSPATRK